MVENQDRQLHHITTLLSTRPTPEPQTTAAKRGGSEIIDLTMDHHELEHSKKQDLKATPQTKGRNVSAQGIIHMVDNVRLAQNLSPASQITETQDESDARHPSTWEGFHSPSSYQSPQRHDYTDNRSPLSNLATHPMFRSRGDGIGDESMQAEAHYQETPTSRNTLDDS